MSTGWPGWVSGLLLGVGVGDLGVGKEAPQQKQVRLCPKEQVSALSALSGMAAPEPPSSRMPPNWVQPLSSWGDVRMKVFALKQNSLPN